MQVDADSSMYEVISSADWYQLILAGHHTACESLQHMAGVENGYVQDNCCKVLFADEQDAPQLS